VRRRIELREDSLPGKVQTSSSMSTVIGDMVGPFRWGDTRGSCGERSRPWLAEFVTCSADTGHGAVRHRRTT